MAERDLNVAVEPFGPDPEALRALERRVLEHPAVRQQLGQARHRLLGIDFLDTDLEGKARRQPQPPDGFLATIFDYTNNRVVSAQGRIATPNQLEVTESGDEPPPSQEEFDEAVALLQQDPELGPQVREGLLYPHTPVPPLVESELPDGRVERTLAIGLLPRAERRPHLLVGVNMIRGRIERLGERGTGACGLPWGNLGDNPRTLRRAAGQVWVTVRQGRTVLWRFLALRPGASSGTRGSGVELRFVDYRGKRVLYRAHVPILTVRYDRDACGPFRDWQNEEGSLQAIGTDVAPGFRLCPSPAKTILETGNDTGNFIGVAIYVQGQEVVLVSEMEAGWYRYISEWRLHADGTIRPRFGFSAVTEPCVCNRHHHHPYWRLDFDIRTPGNNVVEEFNEPPLVGSSNWHTKLFEIRRPRDPARKRKWRVRNTATGEGYEVVPGADDGVATTAPDWPYPRGDVWILRYRGSELDDGVNCTTGGPSCLTEADLNRFVNGESINNQDIVIWYASHVTHDVAAEPPGHFGHICGPDLRPFNW